MRNKIKYAGSNVALFVVSFLMTFVVIYFGMDNYRQVKEVEAERMREISSYYSMISSVKIDREFTECPITSGNVFLIYDSTVGDDVFNPITLSILWSAHEELREGVCEQSYLSEIKGRETYVLIGSGLKKYTGRKEGRLYIKINGLECVVGGILKANDFEESDLRCIMIPSSHEAVKVYQKPECGFVYRSSQADARDELIRWVNEFAQVDEEYMEDSDLSLSYSGMDEYQHILSVLIKLLVLFCFGNAAFLAYFWGKKQLYEYMLKRTLGYTRGKLFQEIFAQFMVLEGGTLLISLLLTFLYETFQSRPEIWLRNLQSGFGILVLGFLGLGFLISVLPMVWIVKANPIEVLRTNE